MIKTKITTIGFKKSRLSPRNYFEWRKERAIPAVDRVNSIKDLKNASVLDIGCGFGSLARILADHGAQVAAVEIDRNKLEKAKEFLSGKNIKLIQIENEILPFGNKIFDVVFLFDVIEHVPNPKTTINEVYRVLKPGGLLYVEFTPYYSITGHHLYDYAKWPIHILPRHMIKKIVFGKKIEGFLTADDFWKQFESLNKLKVSDFQKMASGFKKIKERFIVKYPQVFEINISILNYFPFKDVFTMSYEGIFRK